LIKECLNESINSSGLKLNQCQLILTTEFYTKLISISTHLQFDDLLVKTLIKLGNMVFNVLIDQTSKRGLSTNDIQTNLNPLKLESLNIFNNSLKESINESETKITYKQLKQFISLFNK